MRHVAYLGPVVLATLLAPLAVHAQSPGVLRAGLWEITIQTVSPVETPPTVTVVCLTKDDERPKPPKKHPGDDCQVISGGLTGSVLDYAVQCAKKKSSSRARFTYAGERFEGTVTLTEGSHEVSQVVTAIRTGNCDYGRSVE